MFDEEARRAVVEVRKIKWEKYGCWQENVMPYRMSELARWCLRSVIRRVVVPLIMRRNLRPLILHIICGIPRLIYCRRLNVTGAWVDDVTAGFPVNQREWQLPFHHLCPCTEEKRHGVMADESQEEGPLFSTLIRVMSTGDKYGGMSSVSEKEVEEGTGCGSLFRNRVPDIDTLFVMDNYILYHYLSLSNTLFH